MSALHFHLPYPSDQPRRRGRMFADTDGTDEGRPRGGRGRGPGGRGRRGGPGGPGFGPEGVGRGFGPGFGSGPGFGPRPGRRRAPRGDVRNAVLALLAEEPLHGYAVIGKLSERSGGVWRPSPGSVYPVLSQLEDDGLVTADESDGRRVFSLTDAGTAYVAEHADELREPVAGSGPRHHHRERAMGLLEAVRGLGGAAREVARGGTDAQVEAARAVLENARRAIYRILAEEPTAPTGDQPSDEPPGGAPR